MPIRFLLILGAFLLSVLMWVDRACISAAKGDIASDLDFSETQMGWVMAIFSLGYALFQVPGGKLAERFGPRAAMTGVCLAWSAFTALTGLMRGFVPMMLTRFLFGIGEAGGYPTIAKAFSSWLPANERGIANSISFSGGRLGAALAMPGVVWLIHAVDGWQNAFFVFGMVGVFVGAIWFLLFRNTPETHFAVSSSESEHIAASRNPKKKNVEVSNTEEPAVSVLLMLQSPNLLMLMFQYVAHNFTFFFTVTWFFSYLKETHSLSNETTAYYTSVVFLFGVLGNWIAGFTVDGLYRLGKWNLSRRLPAGIGFVLSAIGMSACVNMTTPTSAVAMMCIAILGADMIISPSWSTCLDIGGKSAGSVSGSMNMVGNLGAFVTALAFPYLYAWSGSHKPFFYIAAGLNIVAVFMWFRIRPDRSILEETGGA